MKRFLRTTVLLVIICFLLYLNYPGIINLLNLDGVFSKSAEPIPFEAADPITDPLPELAVHVVDVGHGDCVILQADRKTMVIDTADYPAREQVEAALDRLQIHRIDVLVLTHPHSDHIGNAEYLLKHYDVGTVYMTAKEHTTKQYESLLATLEEMPYVGVQEAKSGVTFSFAGAQCAFLGPLSLDYEELNNTSAVLMLRYGNEQLLFMADAEQEAEEAYLKKYGNNLKADFLKVGHHANNSTGSRFASAVSPKVSVVSMKPLSEYTGKELEYKEAVFRRLEQLGSKVYRTDRDGDITVITDGLSLTVQASK